MGSVQIQRGCGVSALAAVPDSRHATTATASFSVWLTTSGTNVSPEAAERAAQHRLAADLALASLGTRQLRPGTLGGRRDQVLSVSAMQAAAFYSEVAEHRAVWTIRDAHGFPAPKNSDGLRAQPFWSSQSRANRIVTAVPTYADFEVIEIPWHVFEDRWVPGLERDKILVGVNWSGPAATGYDLPASDVLRNVNAVLPDP